MQVCEIMNGSYQLSIRAHSLRCSLSVSRSQVLTFEWDFLSPVLFSFLIHTVDYTYFVLIFNVLLFFTLSRFLFHQRNLLYFVIVGHGNY